MTRSVCDIAFTDSVKALQERHGSRTAYARVAQRGGWRTTVTAELAAFIAERDSIYFATASARGQPYVQHRGGPKGFLKVLDEQTLCFADVRGNRQYISAGNLNENPRAFLFLMDYASRRRIKLWGTAKALENDGLPLTRLRMPHGKAPERLIMFTLVAWDENCPQHITRRFDESEIASLTESLRARIAELERENASLRAARDGLAPTPVTPT